MAYRRKLSRAFGSRSITGVRRMAVAAELARNSYPNGYYPAYEKEKPEAF
jgi:hypothetical protein